MVLGQVLSPALAQQYQQLLGRYRQRKLPELADAPFIQLLSQVEAAEDAERLEKKLLRYIHRSLEGVGKKMRKSALMAALPADLPVCSGVEPYSVVYDAPASVQAKGQLGLRAKERIKAWTIIGPYRGA
ncbi:hypothetical protein WJX72_007521 [[Myrmecia] bisecta]|uniref:Uncharacterized protein n=1 Tax=[Myrmecia] bisecta TaxID=41462 RepID=A0AAW1R7V0_9CHLO